MRAIEQHSEDLSKEPKVVKFLVSYDDEEKLDEIVAYNEIIDFIEGHFCRQTLRTRGASIM